MKTYPECMPCLLRQAIQAAKLSGADEKKVMEVASAIEKEFLPSADPAVTPPKTSRNMHVIIRKLLNNPDPYRAIKEKYNRLALEMYPVLMERVKAAKDRLLTAARIAIAGNVIDFGVNLEFDIERDLEDVLTREFAVFDYDKFSEKASGREDILYLGDNTGETVFDRVLIETIISEFGPRKIRYAVKDSPILNDATHEDAVFAGIDRSAEIISTGCNSPGIVPEYCNDAFMSLYRHSSFIISKGQGNFETLESEKAPIFFLFKVKCDVVAAFTRLPAGSIVLKEGRVRGLEG